MVGWVGFYFILFYFFAPRRIFSSILALIFPRLLLNFNFLVAFNYSRPYLIFPLPLICSLPISASFAFFILRCQPSSSLILISFNSKTILSLKIHLLSPFLDYFLFSFKFIAFFHLYYTSAICVLNTYLRFWVQGALQFHVFDRFFASFFSCIDVLFQDVLAIT